MTSRGPFQPKTFYDSMILSRQHPPTFKDHDNVHHKCSWRSGKDASVRYWILEHPGLQAIHEPRRLRYLPDFTCTIKACLIIAFSDPEEYEIYHKDMSFIIYKLLSNTGEN